VEPSKAPIGVVQRREAQATEDLQAEAPRAEAEAEAHLEAAERRAAEAEAEVAAAGAETRSAIDGPPAGFAQSRLFCENDT
jgi:hypothetical protein